MTIEAQSPARLANISFERLAAGRGDITAEVL